MLFFLLCGYGVRRRVQDRDELCEGFLDILTGDQKDRADDDQIGEQFRVFVRNRPADFRREDRKGGDRDTQKGQSDDERQRLQAAGRQLFAAEGFTVDLDVVPQGEHDVRR